MNDTANTKSEARTLALIEHLEARFDGASCETTSALGEVTLEVPVERLLEVATVLRDDENFQFEVLIDVCGVDYSAYGSSEWITTQASSSGYGRGVEKESSADSEGPRLAVVYHLLSLFHNHRLRLRVSLETDPPIVPSVIGIWSAADWFEREAYDLFGILFDGHPDLRRILTDYGFIGYPFRKDFPLEGHVEMRYDLERQRVVYEPVSIDSRTLVPRVVREDNRYLDEEDQQQDVSDA